MVQRINFRSQRVFDESINNDDLAIDAFFAKLKEKVDRSKNLSLNEKKKVLENVNNMFAAQSSELEPIQSLERTRRTFVSVNVSQEIKPSEEVVQDILNEHENPQIVVWYVGESGLTMEGAQFYKDRVFDHFTSQDKPFKFHLYDLVAWGALRSSRTSIDVRSKIATHINLLEHETFSAIHSADFFEFLFKLDEHTVNYIRQNILKNPVMFMHSSHRTPNSISLGDVLPYPVLEPLQCLDTAEVYSVLQYLEGVFLVKRLMDTTDSSNVVFLLPNDEVKYYDFECLECDLNKILKGQVPAGKRVRVSIIPFKFGESNQGRPYILRGKKVRKSKIGDYL